MGNLALVSLSTTVSQDVVVNVVGNHATHFEPDKVSRRNCQASSRNMPLAIKIEHYVPFNTIHEYPDFEQPSPPVE